MSQKRNGDLGRYVGRYGRFGTIIFSRDDLSQLNFISGRFVEDLHTFGMHACSRRAMNIVKMNYHCDYCSKIGPHVIPTRE